MTYQDTHVPYVMKKQPSPDEIAAQRNQAVTGMNSAIGQEMRSNATRIIKGSKLRA